MLLALGIIICSPPQCVITPELWAATQSSRSAEHFFCYWAIIYWLLYIYDRNANEKLEIEHQTFSVLSYATFTL
jgi:hypothetical protein